MTPTPVPIDYISTVPLFLEPLAFGKPLSHATGFILLIAGQDYLITNWHVVTGRNAQTEVCMRKDCAVPDTLRIWHHVEGLLGHWEKREEALLDDDGTPRWLQLPGSPRVDVIALPISRETGLAYAPLPDSTIRDDVLIINSDHVSIIGYPNGKSAYGRFPIWKTGHVASDIGLNYEEKPVFLVDATTKPGMSGAPVIARRFGPFLTPEGDVAAARDRFLGVYSGLISDFSDVGMVWKADVVQQVVRLQAPS